MSQFVGYTLELVLKGPPETKVKGIISKIVNNSLVVSHAQYLDGSNKVEKELFIQGKDIQDLKVIALPQKKRDKRALKNKDKQKPQLQQQQQQQPQQQQESSKRQNYKVKEEQQHNYYDEPVLQAPSYGRDNEWESTGPRDVKQLEEFDFASNLQKFDKESVFKEISMNDKTKPEERLVGHNKLPQKTKYDIHEMVLENKKDEWDSINVNDSSDSEVVKYVDAEESQFQVPISQTLH
ncbi:unnamed protein product [Ambrosiozyma monospora]|uniref:Unnamed protein product n=1 Tax=Ambrosiozyma monospora TaxID=43982 RepID=A0ACB5T0K4_AMBMO|nr:unnamed protein product [Ambrosiozyma monospora]